jgi:hypothetical protein
MGGEMFPDLSYDCATCELSLSAQPDRRRGAAGRLPRCGESHDSVVGGREGGGWTA